MAFARFENADIHYDVIGDRGPWVALVSRGREPMRDSVELARHLAGQGCRALIHDRRSCGRSSLDLDTRLPEEDVWADDLARLIDHLDAEPPVVLGWSRGARVAIRFALRHPDATRGLALWGLSGGPLAVRFLEELYFGKPVRAAKRDGMDAVLAIEPFAGLLADDPSKGPLLRALDVDRFVEAMQRQRLAFLVNGDQPVMGLSDDELRMVHVPTLIVPYYDQMHPHETALHARDLIYTSRLVDYEPTRRATDATHLSEDQAARDQATVAQIVCEFVSSLESSRGTNSTKRSAWHTLRASVGRSWAPR